MINFIFLSMPDIVLSGMQYLSAGFCRLLIALCTPLFLFSCKEKEQPLSKAEALEVARKIDSSINKKQPRYFSELMDVDMFSERIAKAGDPKYASAVKKEMKSIWHQLDMGDKIVQSLGEEGQYKLVKQYEKEGIHHLIFRLYATDGLNYHDIELTKYKGKPRIADIYIYLSGESFSKTVADLAEAFSDSKEDDGTDIAGSIKRIREYMRTGDYEKAEKFYDGLPATIRDQKSVRLMAILLYKDYDDDKYLQQLEAFKDRFPDMPNIDLLMIDAYIMRKNYAKAIEAVDKLDMFIDKDPFLDFYRGLIYNMEEKTDEAAVYFEKTYKAYPGFGDVLLELIHYNISEQNNDKANQLIDTYKANKAFNQQMLDNYLATQPQFEYKNAQ